MKVMITGIAGHLGSRFAQWLLTNVKDVIVVGIDDLTCGFEENIPEGIERFYKLTLGHGEDIESLFKTVDYVFHFAGYTPSRLSHYVRRFDCACNQLGSYEVLNACIQLGTIKRLIFASDLGVYGCQPTPFKRTAPALPSDPLSISKYAVERHLEAALATHNQDYAVLRLGSFYGPYQNLWTPFTNVLGNWMMAQLNGQAKLIYGDGSELRSFVYVDDLLPAIWQAATRPRKGAVFNLGGKVPITMREIAALHNHVCGGSYKRLETTQFGPHGIHADVTTSELEIGFSDSTPLERGLREMWRWARAAVQRYPERIGSQAVCELEVSRGLPHYWKGSIG